MIRKRPRFNGSPSDHALTEQWPAQLRTDDVDGATYHWGGANDIGVMTIATFTPAGPAPLDGYQPAPAAFPALQAAPEPQPAPCRRTNPHTPHDTPGGRCPGTAPEFPSEPIEIISGEVLPEWERDLLDEQARQMALPILADVPVTERAAIGDSLRLPVIWCEMPSCINWHLDRESAGERDARTRAAAAGWRTDALGRLACPPCQQTRADYRTPRPVTCHHPEVPRRWWGPCSPQRCLCAGGRHSGEYTGEEDAFRLGVEAELGHRVTREDFALACAIGDATLRHHRAVTP